MPDDAKQQFIKKYRTDYEPKISPDGQMMTVGTKTYDRNTNYNSKTADPTKVNTVDAWIETTPGKGGDVAAAFKDLVGGGKGGDKGGGGKGGKDQPPPAPGLNVPNAPMVGPPSPGPYQRYLNSGGATQPAPVPQIQTVPVDQLRSTVKQGYGPGGSNTQQLQAAAAELARRGLSVNE